MTDGLLAPGQILAGKYRVERILGQGGMGFVIAARHVRLDDYVAMKFLHANYAKMPDVVERFVTEARAARKIANPHAVKVLDIGNTDDGSPFLVMEYLQGDDLGHVLQRGPIPMQVAVDYILQASEALAEAHSVGMVHRDIKPANFFLTTNADGSPFVKVLDFGIAKLADSNLTGSKGQIGTILYSSPEQIISSKDVDLRSDIWSIGVTLYELLSGRTPFDFAGNNLLLLTNAIVSGPHTPLLTLLPDLDPKLAAVIDTCLEKDRAQRFPTLGELATAIAPFSGPRSASSIELVTALGRKAKACMDPETTMKSPALTAPFEKTQPMNANDPSGGSDEPRSPSRETLGSAQTMSPVPESIADSETFARRRHARKVIFAAVGVAVVGLVSTILFVRTASNYSDGTPLRSASSITLSPSLTRVAAISTSAPTAPSSAAIVEPLSTSATSAAPSASPSLKAVKRGVGGASAPPSARSSTKNSAPKTEDEKVFDNP